MEIDRMKFDLALANKCYSMNDLASAANLSITTFSKIFTGQSKPLPKTLGKIAKALDVPVTELLKK